VPRPVGAELAIDDLSGGADSRRARANAAGNVYALRYAREGIPDADRIGSSMLVR
jgi:hypothetical protein